MSTVMNILQSGQQTANHAMPCHAMPRHATPRHATPRHAKPSQAKPSNCGRPLEFWGRLSGNGCNDDLLGAQSSACVTGGSCHHITDNNRV